jgi:hypothetical protein
MSEFNPSGADITKAILSSHDGSKTTDISSLIVEFEIFQSMDAPSYNGTITLFDTTGLLEGFPLRAEELIDMTIISYDLGTEVNIKTHVYKVSDILPSESNNGVLFVIHFVSNITFNASKRKIVRSFSGKMDEIVKEVFNTYYARLGQGQNTDQDPRARSARRLPYETRKYQTIEEPDRFFYIQETAAGRTRPIIPNFTPQQAILFLCARSFAGDSCPSQTFRFFETLENYYYATDEFFITTNSYNDKIDTLFYAPAASVDPTSPEDQTNRIEDLRIVSKGLDVATDIFSGSYRNEVLELDLIRRRLDILKFNYSNPADARYIDMSGNRRNLADNPHTEAFRNDTFTEENAKEFLVFRDYTRNGDLPSQLHNDRHLSQIISNRVSYYHHLNNTMISAAIKGRLDLRPGKMINLDIKQLNSNGNNIVNDTLSGKYMIKSVSHKRGMDGILNTGLQLVKFDWSGTSTSPSTAEWTVG